MCSHWYLVLLVAVITAVTGVRPSARCPSLGSAAHRQIEEEDIEQDGVYRPGDMVYFNCTHGYQLNGYSEVTCHEDGQWDPLPQCVEIQCRMPPVAHLRVLESSQVTWSTGEWVRLSCEPGYNLNPYSSSNLQCVGKDEGTPDGWDRSLPACKSVHCPPIVSSDIDNGYVTASGSGSTTGWFSVGDNVTVTCNDGYQLRGPSTRTCREAGTWSGTLQTCDAEDTHCGDPGQPVGGKKYGTSYNEGDTVSFQCNAGRQMIGSRVRTCLSLGLWSGQEVQCIGKDEYMGKEELTESFGTLVRQLSAVTASSKDTKNLILQYENKPVELSGLNMIHVNRNSRSLTNLKSDHGLDVFFAIDTSKSIPHEQRQFAVEIIIGIMEELNISPNKGTQVGLVAFNNTAWYYKVPHEIRNIPQLRRALDDILNQATGGGTAISKALQMINTKLIPNAAQARKTGMGSNVVGKSVPRAVVLFSDGNANMGGNPVHQKDEIEKNHVKTSPNAKIEFYCIGLGEVNKKLLMSLATTQTPEHLLITKGVRANANGFSVHDMVQSLLNNNVDFSPCGKVGRQLYTQGVYAEQGAWPWMGGMFIDNKFLCGVSLLEDGSDRSRWVLTAAHCINGQYRQPNLKVKFGSVYSNLEDPDEVEAASLLIPAETVYPHEDFVGSTMVNDIALIRLKEAVKYRVDIRPVCLPPQQADNLYKANNRAVMTGWGRWNSSIDFKSRELKQLTIKLFSLPECHHEKNTGKNITDGKNFCGGGIKDHNEEEMDACHMDSGGPLVHKPQGADRWTQIGIVSFGVKHEFCRDPGTAGAYVKVSSYIDWIKEKMASVSDK